MSREELVGAWKLVSYDLRLADGIVIRPMGEGVQGILLYDPAGYVAVELVEPERPNFASGDWLRGTPEEISAAFEGSLAYYGTYDWNEAEGTIVHHIIGSTFPNWSGTDQVRNLELSRGESSPDRLTLTSPTLALSGEQVKSRLVFERASPLR